MSFETSECCLQLKPNLKLRERNRIYIEERWSEKNRSREREKERAREREREKEKEREKQQKRKIIMVRADSWFTWLYHAWLSVLIIEWSRQHIDQVFYFCIKTHRIVCQSLSVAVSRCQSSVAVSGCQLPRWQHAIFECSALNGCQARAIFKSVTLVDLKRRLVIYCYNTYLNHQCSNPTHTPYHRNFEHSSLSASHSYRLFESIWYG